MQTFVAKVQESKRRTSKIVFQSKIRWAKALKFPFEHLTRINSVSPSGKNITIQPTTTIEEFSVAIEIIKTFRTWNLSETHPPAAHVPEITRVETKTIGKWMQISGTDPGTLKQDLRVEGQERGNLLEVPEIKLKGYLVGFKLKRDYG